ncbi:MAG: cyclic nucleotide-binding protein [Acidobacteria bacterium]|nr:MAG: cyclic nucleotide-binding protein [Acidobacteriota bacterium]
MDLEFFSSVPLFDGFEKEDLERILKLTSRREYSKDRILVHENDSGESFFLILNGKVKVTAEGQDGKEVILSFLGPGEFFGELALVDDEPRSANVTAVEQTTVLILHRNDFLTLLETNGQMMKKFMSILSKRLRHANDQIKSLALLDVLGRIAKLMLDMAEKEGVKLLDGSVVFRRPTHQEIASMVGTSRETVSRMISELNKSRFITISGKDIIVRKEMREEYS